MAKFGVVLVSHSEYIAKGLKELVDEMNDGSVQVVAAGGADGGRIGTSAIKIQGAIESVEDCDHILIYADLGSSILSAETAIDLIDEDALLICVDNHTPALAISEELLDKAEKIVVIDHHRRGEDFVDSPILTYLEPAASSTVELVVELFEYQRVEIEVLPTEATVMYAGMLVDTNYFRNHVGSRTFQIASKLKEKQANVSRAYEFLQDDYKTTQEKMSISANAYRFGNDILIAYGNEEEIYTRPLLAKVGNELLNIAEIKAVFVAGRVDKDKIAISARSKTEVNVQLIMEKLGGGGHFSMAACQVEENTVKETIDKLEEAIDQYVDDRG